MTRSYLGLAGAIVALAVVLALVGRPRSPETAPPATVAATPVVDLAIAIGAGQVSPASANVPKGCRVRLRVTSPGSVSPPLVLAGYEDRVRVPALARGAVWTGEFLADRPGEDFAWLLDGAPAGRLTVTGSHLVEGHR
ncbi:MAG TPA: hypothetical protein VJY35_16815 [Candidatus Eisenbacteria bacterium]|nr:hypothetical protein [Candidatus Eisenbacteria bacterium]